MIEQLFLTVLSISLSASVVIALLLLLSHIWSKTFRAILFYWVWLVLALRLAVPVSLSVPSTPVVIEPPTQTVQFAGNGAAQSTPTASASASGVQNSKVITSTTEAKAAPSSLSVTELAAYLWAIGFGLFLLYHFAGYALFWLGVKRHSSAFQSPIYQELLMKQHLRRAPTLIQCDRANSPMLAGFFRPVILIPAQEIEPRRLELILRHELVHFRRYDLFYKLLFVLANAVHWFNPLVYLAFNRASADLENACDEEVLREASLTDRQEYASAMLDTMRNSVHRTLTLSTHFSPGKKTIKQRFERILDTGKKRRGLVILCLCVLLIGAASILIACRLTDQTFEPVAAYSCQDDIQPTYLNWQDNGNSYSIDKDGMVTISYDNGACTIKAPVTIQPGISEDNTVWSENRSGFYLSKCKTAVACGNSDGKVSIWTTDNMGKSWNTSEIDAEGVGVSWICLGFTTENDGWLVICNFHGMGSESHFLYKTESGGKTWTPVNGNINEVYSRMLTCAGFANDQIGFLGFRNEFENAPALYETKDGGVSWEPLTLTLPDKFDEYDRDPLSPVFHGASGILPVLVRAEDGNCSTIYFTTNDYGDTWTYCDSDGFNPELTSWLKNTTEIPVYLPSEWLPLRQDRNDDHYYFEMSGDKDSYGMNVYQTTVSVKFNDETDLLEKNGPISEASFVGSITGKKITGDPPDLSITLPFGAADRVQLKAGVMAYTLDGEGTMGWQDNGWSFKYFPGDTSSATEIMTALATAWPETGLQVSTMGLVKIVPGNRPTVYYDWQKDGCQYEYVTHSTDFAKTIQILNSFCSII
jgi:bla regulator protein BlaR1